jgi:hypothetical protein
MNAMRAAKARIFLPEKIAMDRFTGLQIGYI